MKESKLTVTDLIKAKKILDEADQDYYYTDARQALRIFFLINTVYFKKEE